MQKNLLTVGVPGFAEFSALAGGDGLAASAKNSTQRLASNSGRLVLVIDHQLFLKFKH